MIQGFRQVLMRGNVIDLAVAVVIGGAFGKIVTAVVDGFINPLIAALFGQPDLSDVGRFTIHHAQFSLGVILDAILDFLIIAASVYFLIVVPVNRLMALRRRREVEEVEEAPPSEEVVLLRDIRDLLARENTPSS
jgi:large conductance mechanosensitive channel